MTSELKTASQIRNSNQKTGPSLTSQSLNEQTKVQIVQPSDNVDTGSTHDPEHYPSASADAIPANATNLSSSHLLSQDPSIGLDFNNNQSKKSKKINRQQVKEAREWMLLFVQLIGAIAIPLVLLYLSIGVSQGLQNASSRINVGIATSQQEQTILDTYLDRMQDLLVSYHLSDPKAPTEIRALARARTISVLSELSDGAKKKIVIQFLYESKLISIGNPIIDLNEADLSNADLRQLNLREVNFYGVNLSGAKLIKVTLIGANLSKANLSSEDLTNVILSGANLSGANLSKANLSSEDLTNVILSGANLSGAIFSNATLTGVNLSGANLSGDDLTRLANHDLTNVIFTGANLNGANLSGDDLTGHDLSNTTLIGADLHGANLFYADLSNANLTNADLSGANLTGVILNSTNLKGATMPDGSKHH
jgi:uncharacterized protein YjbI with pentapeptide repeats